jgi:hypothetical protein
LQIKTTNWPPADEINTCNSDLVMAITEVIAGCMIPIENHLISSIDLFSQTLNKLGIKLRKREMGPLSFLPPTDAPERKKEEGP